MGHLKKEIGRDSMCFFTRYHQTIENISTQRGRQVEMSLSIDKIHFEWLNEIQRITMETSYKTSQKMAGRRP